MNSTVDEPKSLGKMEAVLARTAALKGQHIAPLTSFVDAMRLEKGSEYRIPYFDPLDGGVGAEVLFLLEAPGPKAVRSGFISRNNPDNTARNMFLLCQDAGVARERSVLWNIVPWYIGDGNRIRAARASDIELGLTELQRLLKLLPKLRALVLVGRKAQRIADWTSELSPRLTIFRSPHPSPLFVNHALGNRDKILQVFKSVAEMLTASAPTAALPSPTPPALALPRPDNPQGSAP